MGHEIVSRQEAIEQGRTHYFTGKPCGKGHTAPRFVCSRNCHECVVAYAVTWKRRNPEVQKACSKRWVEKNRSTARAINRASRARNVDAARARCARWAAENPDMKRLSNASRRAAKLNATPAWALEKDCPAAKRERALIRAIYASCPEGHHVDHIVPLVNERVCGLHVSWNLRPLPGAENCSKGNRVDFDDLGSLIGNPPCT